jgi:hypothetical protein
LSLKSRIFNKYGFRDILEIYFALEDEPWSLEVVQRAMKQRQNEKEFWSEILKLKMEE